MPWWEWVVAGGLMYAMGFLAGYWAGYRRGLLAEVIKTTRTIARRLSDGENIRDYEEREPPLDGSGPR